MSIELAQGAGVRCSGCGSEISPALVSCPVCHRLVHGERLRELASAAELAEREDRVADALGAWREALPLLPMNSRQAAVITERINRLGERVSASGPAPAGRDGSGNKGLVGGLILLAVLLLSKAKFLLAGFTKAGTLFTMAASLGVYWTSFGWKFALGLVLSIYVHEMGHVAALRRYGIKATAPMFIPGFGAVVRLKDRPVTAIEDARVGLAGPVWGLMATLAAYAIYVATYWASLGAIAKVSAFINLFNLLPIWQLDGSRGLRSLSKGQLWGLVLIGALTWRYTGEGMLVLILLLMAARGFGTQMPRQGDRTGFALFAVLVIALAVLSQPHLLGLPIK